MKSDSTIKFKSDIFKIGLYQIIGGGIGAIIILISLIMITPSTELEILVFFIMFGFFVYSIFCGTLCLYAKETALRHSLINQFLQVLGFAMFGYAFNYVAGLYLTIGLDFSNSFDIKFGAGISKFDFNINRETERTEMNFNLVAFGLIFWIDKLMHKIKEETDIQEISTVAD